MAIIFMVKELDQMLVSQHQNTNHSMSFQITKLIIKVKKDKNVKTMKIGLKALGYPIDNETNIFDEQLESAIKTFQQDNNLKVNGNFDKNK